ncbi:MAG: hypothetical protein LBD06_01510 [Candidatus Accumulibacter sp.]|nr:hypothetical protein [Accumulibacter sp.]
MNEKPSARFSLTRPARFQRIPEDRNSRGQKTDRLGRFAPSNERKTQRSVFPHSPGAKRRKPICLLSSQTAVF